MITKFLLKLRILPRWVIIVIDVVIVAFCTLVGYLLRFNFDWEAISKFGFLIGILINSVSCIVSLLVTKSYAGIVRYTGLKDGLRVLYTLILTHSFTLTINYFSKIVYGITFVPPSVVLISFLASFLFLFQYRLLIKNVFSYYGKTYISRNNIAIFGAGQMGLITKHLIENDTRSDYIIQAFFEDDENKIGKEINGTSIFSFEKYKYIIRKYKLDELIIAVNELSLDRKNYIVDVCLTNNLKVRTVPNFKSWIQGELSINQIKQVRIDDLLERESIIIQNSELLDQIKNSVVLITGAAGSIGSELVRQVVLYQPMKIVLIDQAESSLYDLFSDLKTDINLEYIVADITNSVRIERIFDEHRPDIIFHAAAYKHVPLMEDNPHEAISCNVLGTKILADFAQKFEVRKFVMVSTDKAVNPTSVMGASKRIAEMYVQSLNLNSFTSFITTRFGNVLGSNGSVIPHFKKQIQNGGPITVTHPEITRYFMTIGEACELILEAGCMGKGGEIFLFDMGKSVKIVELAKKMIRLSGLEPYADIDIVFTGLRQGEKLYEELLTSKENSLPTHHSKIMIAQVSVPDHDLVKSCVNELHDLATTEYSGLDLVSKMKKLVPEFKSNRSMYEVLDN